MNFLHKIKKVFRAVAQIIKNPRLLNLVLEDNTLWQNRTPVAYQNGLPVIALDQLFPDFSETLHCVAYLDGGSMTTDLALLKSLCRLKKDCAYFEIGTWRGESTANVAETAKECYTLSLSREEMLAFGWGTAFADAHYFFSKNNDKIIHLKGNSLKFDFAALNKKFDVIFIDGSHHYEDIVSDTKNVFQHLVHDNSVVVWHDYGFSPEKIRYETLNGILAGVPEHVYTHLYHVANTMCAMYIKGNFETRVHSLYANPERQFEVTLKSKRLD